MCVLWVIGAGYSGLTVGVAVGGWWVVPGIWWNGGVLLGVNCVSVRSIQAYGWIIGGWGRVIYWVRGDEGDGGSS